MHYKRIKELREDNDLKQKEIAALLKTTQQNYSKIENGTQRLYADDLKILSIFYKVSADYILEIE